MKTSVGTIILLFLGINIKAHFGCFAMPEPDVNVNVDVDIKFLYRSKKEDASNECLGGSIAFGSQQCLTFKFWSVDEHKSFLNWVDAKDSCNSMCGRLATIKHPNETLDYVNKIDGPDFNGHHLWTGGNDIVKEGSWVWTDNKPFDDDFPWGKDEPGAGTDKNCMIVDSGYGYATRNCAIKFSYICENVLLVELEVVSIQSDAIGLNWKVSDPISCTVTHYTVQYVGGKTKETTDTNYKITGLMSNTEYNITVTAHVTDSSKSVSDNKIIKTKN